MPADTRWPSIARLAGVAVAVIGVAALLASGTGFGVAGLSPRAWDMHAGAALGTVLAGSALAIAGGPASSAWRTTGLVMALLVAAMGVTTSGYQIFDARLDLATLFVLGEGGAGVTLRGPTSPWGALGFAAAGLALAVVTRPRLRLLVWLLSALLVVIGMVSLLGNLENAGLFVEAVQPQMTWPAALAFTLLGIGSWFASHTQHAALQPEVRNRSSIEIRVFGGAVLVIVLLLVGGGTTYRASAEAARSARWVADAQEVRALLARMYALSADAESAARAYLLIRNDRQRDNFFVFDQAARAASVALQAHLARGGVQPIEMARLYALQDRRLDQLEDLVAVLKADGEAAMRALGRSQRGRLGMNELRALVDRIDDDLVQRLATGEARSRGDRHKALLLLNLTLVSAICAFVALLYTIRREMLARAGTDAEMRRLNATLEQRVAERTAALQENQVRLADMFEYAHDALVMSNGQGMVLQLNRRAETLFGWTRAELVGQQVERLLPPDRRETHPALRAAFQPGTGSRPMGRNGARVHARRKDGSLFPVEITLSPLGTGARFVVVASVRDITEREEMTAALLQSATLYRQTLDAMLEGCCIVEFDWTYLYVNAAAAQQMRQPAEALIGQSVKNVHAEMLAPAIVEANRRCMQERVAVRAEGEVTYVDGSSGWFEVSCRPVPEGIVVFSVDATERKRAEAGSLAIQADLERRVAQRTAELDQLRSAAEAANRAKSAFLAAMSHEIRTPMNGVIGMVDVLAHSEMPESQADAVRTIRSSAFALLGIIDDILDFSKIEADRLDLEHVPVVLSEVIESVCQTVLPVAIERGVDVDLFIAPRVPAQVWTDPTRLRQVLFNLLGNAIKFSGGQDERRGHVSLRVDLRAGPPERLELRFDDNGIGMAEQTLAKLFSPFTQAETSTTRRFGGTGLGLTISKRLVELMEGHIEVASTLGEGSSFVVDLPVERVADAAPQAGPDLAGLDCILLGEHPQVDDLAAYLEHASARLHRVAGLTGAVARSVGLQRPVVIQAGWSGDDPAQTFTDAFADAGDVRHVLITRGWHGEPAHIAANALQLDGNGLRRSVFLRAVAVAAGRESPSLLQANLGLALHALPRKAATVAEARARGRLILVAEDDAINQKVILRQIELLGHTAEIAHDGAEALRLWQAGPYALLLTDLHMPELDGYELARAIRAQEAVWDPTWTGAGAGAWFGSGDAHMPILALTANAIRGEAARAREAGMDEYLTKPLQLHQLQAALARWMPVPDSPHDGDTVADELVDPPPQPTARPAVDTRVLQSFIGSDPLVLQEFLADYRAAAQVQAAELRVASAAGDTARIGAIAHRLKASSRSVGAVSLGDACAALENACRAGTLRDVAANMAVFELALAAVEAHLDSGSQGLPR